MKTANNPLSNHLKSQHTLHEFEMMIATLVSERDEVAAERDEFKQRYGVFQGSCHHSLTY